MKEQKEVDSLHVLEQEGPFSIRMASNTNVSILCEIRYLHNRQDAEKFIKALSDLIDRVWPEQEAKQVARG